MLLRAGVRHKSWRNSSSLSVSALALALTPGVAAGAWSGTTAARGADAGLDGTDAGFLSYFSAEPSHATTRPRCILRLNIIPRLAYVIPNP